MTASKYPFLEDLSALTKRYFDDGDKHVDHNFDIWRRINGAVVMLSDSKLTFNPVDEYWRMPERRILISFFGHRFRGLFCPVAHLRQLAHKTMLHFDRAREDGKFGPPVSPAEQPARWTEISDQVCAVAESLDVSEHYGQLRSIWPMLREASLQAALMGFVGESREGGPEELKGRGFKRSLPWLAYLGLRSMDDFWDRQRFFFSLAACFCSTNAYVNGGSLNIAPILRNNDSAVLVNHVRRWADGETPVDTNFVVEGRSRGVDARHHMAIVEQYGFLNLHRLPYYNTVSGPAYGEVTGADNDLYVVLAKFGDKTRKHLEQHPEEADRLAGAFRKLSEDRGLDSSIKFEAIKKEDIAKEHPQEVEALADWRFVDELKTAAIERTRDMDNLDVGAAMLHLIVDAAIYAARSKKPVREIKRTVKGKFTAKDHPPGKHTSMQLDDTLCRLPEPLVRYANDALGLLRAGYHVLLAGPPGTGKTQIAQFVGHAWNHDLTEVSTELLKSEAPVTTVANSAWAPFHTIGGILPNKNNVPVPRPGIFIDPDVEGSSWQLRGECIVLDEMNRADLDRCIGELYPLLSQSVDRVAPAGIADVQWVEANPKFRVVATVNDATLDDIVFPISEGLSRRFVRIDLPGASSTDLSAYYNSAASVSEERLEAATTQFESLFEQFSSDEGAEDDDDRLPFGVGYFKLLLSWIADELKLSPEFSEQDVSEQAQQLQQMCLSPAMRKHRNLDNA